MKNRFVIFLTILSLLCSASLQAQVNYGSRGTDFWLTFGQNLNHGAMYIHLQIRFVAGDQETKVTLRFTDPAPTRTFTLAAGEAFTHSFTTFEKNALYRTATGVSNGSVRITSDHPIMAYAFS